MTTKFICIAAFALVLVTSLVINAAPGDLDLTFGIGGKVITNIEGVQFSTARALAVQSDGKIVAAGYGGTNGHIHFALIRYNPDGSLDASFGTGGIVETSTGNVEDLARAVGIQPDGQIGAAGYRR